MELSLTCSNSINMIGTTKNITIKFLDNTETPQYCLDDIFCEDTEQKRFHTAHIDRAKRKIEIYAEERSRGTLQRTH